MKRGQLGIGLVILGVVAIIAVIGLVLLFTRASKTEGALLTDLSIGNIYGGGQQQGAEGIAVTFPTSEYYPGQPMRAYPAYAEYPGGVSSKGSRTPAFIVSGYFKSGGFASIEDLYAAERDLMMAGIPVPHDLFNCYAVPNKGSHPEVYGRFPPASSAEPRPPQTQLGKIGGDLYCYANSVGAEQQVPDSEAKIRENILIRLVDNDAGVEKYDWGEIYVNGVRVALAWQSEKTFPFPQ